MDFAIENGFNRHNSGTIFLTMNFVFSIKTSEENYSSAALQDFFLKNIKYPA